MALPWNVGERGFATCADRYAGGFAGQSGGATRGTLHGGAMERGWSRLYLKFGRVNEMRLVAG